MIWIGDPLFKRNLQKQAKKNKIVFALDSGSPAGMTWRAASGARPRIAAKLSLF
jgi:hypothetical protein